jgi:hypothetical protein
LGPSEKKARLVCEPEKKKTKRKEDLLCWSPSSGKIGTSIFARSATDNRGMKVFEVAREPLPKSNAPPAAIAC